MFDQLQNRVNVRQEQLLLPTYLEPEAEKYPMFAENRVHQRTSGNPYPMAVVTKVSRAEPVEKAYQAIILENAFINLVILPELGGRIYAARDKVTGYDFFYRQHVIKPALIGVLGSWISGGVEFNFPFHHRASTFMPTDYTIEQAQDGAVTVWLADHDPLERMRGCVGICLRPDEAVISTQMRVTNRTPVTRSFLWWENAAVPVNPDYQIFFPPDVNHVNFHYHRSVTSYPIARGVYNGIRFGDGVDISKHKNTRSPTSFFSAPSQFDYFGGYDHGRQCGVVHVASHHTSPGKKLFTWAYGQLGYSWEKALTDTDGPYAELMAGSYSDNQPDFAWLEPCETKEFCQCWYPIGALGVPSMANRQAAIHIQPSENGWSIAVQPTKRFEQASIVAVWNGQTVLSETADLAPGEIVRLTIGKTDKDTGSLTVQILDNCGQSVLVYRTTDEAQYDRLQAVLPEPWTDLPSPAAVTDTQDLYLMGLHIRQYRDPCVNPDVYWIEAVRRTPEHAPSLMALGESALLAAKYDQAKICLEKAKAVLTRYNGNPPDGKVFYLLGLVYRELSQEDQAYDAFYKASWNAAQYIAAMLQLARLDGCRKDWPDMLIHARAVLSKDARNGLAMSLGAIALRQMKRQEEAIALLQDALTADPLDHLAAYLHTLMKGIKADAFIRRINVDRSQMVLDLSFELLAAGEEADVVQLLLAVLQNPGVSPLSPMVPYLLATLRTAEDPQAALLLMAQAARLRHPVCYPFRLEELAVLRNSTAINNQDATAWYFLGCCLYSKKQAKEAAQAWERALQINPPFAAARRCLAMARYSHLDRRQDVLPLLQQAYKDDPDEQLLCEICYVMARTGVPPAERIRFISAHAGEKPRSDIVLEWAHALRQNNQPEKSLDLLAHFSFIPCEGGEHAVAETYMLAHHNLGRKALSRNNCEEACQHFRAAQVLPDNLGAGLWHEALLVPQQFYEALCLRELGQTEQAEQIEQHILRLSIDYFSNMHLRSLPYWQACIMLRQNREEEGRQLLTRCLHEWQEAMNLKDAGYFKATPFFIVYMESPQDQRTGLYAYLCGLALQGLGRCQEAIEAFARSLEANPVQHEAWLELELSRLSSDNFPEQIGSSKRA
jgi:tetratricopeptide (TPR) repeat protein